MGIMKKVNGPAEHSVGGNFDQLKFGIRCCGLDRCLRVILKMMPSLMMLNYFEILVLWLQLADCDCVCY